MSTPPAVWSNDTSERLVVQILTAKPASRISAQAAHLVDEFSGGF